MQLREYDTYAVFELPGAPADAWTLCLIDDEWAEAPALFKEVGYPLTQEKIDTWAENIRYNPTAINQIAVGYVLFHGEKLPRLRRLVFSDFPREPDGSDFLAGLLTGEEARANLAFLIDIHDRERPKEKVPDSYVFPQLEKAGVPLSRCAFFTQGVPADVPLERIIKAYFVDRGGAPLEDWWERMRGRIDDSYFEEQTGPTYRGRANWHNPSTLSLAKSERGFEAFLREQATRDGFGVWNWIYQVVFGRVPVEPVAQAYAYLCGKAFLKSSKAARPRYFPYTALRGLAFGIGRGQLVYSRDHLLPVARAVAVVDDPARAAPPFEDEEGRRPIDNIRYYGEYTTGGGSFEEFAYNLSDWLYKLETDTNGTARLSQVDLEGKPDHCLLRLHFTRPLPREIFSGDEKGGLVTRAYTGLHRTFPGDQPPAPARDYTHIVFRFQDRPKDQPVGMRGEHGAAPAV